MRFESIVPEGVWLKEQALDVHPDPPPGWARVAVCSKWTDARKLRPRWPHAAVIGPLRTPDGLDLFIRSLLANPQIRIVVLDGVALSIGHVVIEELETCWKTGGASGVISPSPFRVDVRPYLFDLMSDIKIMKAEGSKTDLVDEVELAIREAPDRDRKLEKMVLPPPVPIVTAMAPEGDPGERVAADKLSEVFPQILDRILKFGRIIPSQYGACQELLNFVSVIRDPKASLDELGELPHRCLGLTLPAVEEYATLDLMGTRVGESATYGYGARMHGFSRPGAKDESHPGDPGTPVDQVLHVSALLHRSNDTRAAYLSPWLPRKDSGLESGRPCLVGVWFRIIGTGKERRLTMTVAFRSQDMLRAYPVNVAACCYWLISEATALDVQPGALTCVSYSAHVYDQGRDYAELIVRDFLPRGIMMDPRSLWRIERYVDGGRLRLRAIAKDPKTDEVVATFDAPNPGQLRRKVAASGLITEIGNAMWIGSEIERVGGGIDVSET